MTVYELRSRYLEKHPNGHFFDSDTLKFFGETLSSMRVLRETVQKRDSMGEMHTCYTLSKLSKDFTGEKRRNYAYFDVDTFEHVI